MKVVNKRPRIMLNTTFEQFEFECNRKERTTLNAHIKIQRSQYVEIRKVLRKIKKYLDKKQHLFTNSIEELDNIIKDNYSRINDERLSFFFKKLSKLTYKGTDTPVFNLEYYDKYLEYCNDTNEITIKDLDNNYLKDNDTQFSKKVYAKVKYLEEENQGKIPIFITITNPTEYHYYKKKYPHIKESKTLIKNEKCAFESLGDTIDQSFKNIKKLNRKMYNHFKDQLIKQGIDPDFAYIKTLEHHTNKSVHSHSLFYLTEEQAQIFYRIFYNLVYSNGLQQVKLEDLRFPPKGKKKAKPSSYIIKYISKNFKDKKDNKNSEYRRYFSKNNIFTSSDYKHTTQQEIDKVYTYLKKRNPKLFNKMKSNKKKSLYKQIEEYIVENVTVEYEEVETVIKTKSIKDYIDKQFNTLWEWFGNNKEIIVDKLYKHFENINLKDLKEEYTAIKIKKLVFMYDRKEKKEIYCAGMIE